MVRGRRLVAIAAAVAVLAAGMMLAPRPGQAASRAHVYLFRGLADVFSVGMDELADEINKRGVYATAHSHNEWKSIAERAAADYKAGKEGPIILIGHSLGADAVMEMADYLGDRGVPVALAVPFDATQSFAASGNIGRVLNLTQRDYAHMRGGPGFHGSINNVDLSADPTIGHLNIDESPRLHAMVIAEIVALVGGRTLAAPGGAKPAPARPSQPASAETGAAAARPGEGNPSGTPVIALPEGRGATPNAAAPVTPPPQIPVAAPQPVNPAAQIPD
jgi:hypothetical protein